MVKTKDIFRINTTQIDNDIHFCINLKTSRKDKHKLLYREKCRERQSKLSCSPQWERLHLLPLLYSLSSFRLVVLLPLLYMHLLSMHLGFCILILHFHLHYTSTHNTLILLQITHAHSHIYFVNIFIIHSCVFVRFQLREMTEKGKLKLKKKERKKLQDSATKYSQHSNFCLSDVSQLTLSCKCSALNAANCREKH